MTNRIVVALLLGGALALPAVAQENTTTTPAPVATQQDSTTSTAPAHDTMPMPAATDATAPAATTPAASATVAPTTTVPTTTSTAPDAATAKAPLQPTAREGFWGRVNPMARKKYVQRQTGPIRDRVNELDELTAANSKNIKDVDARAQQAYEMASAKATTADQHALDATSKATMAQQTAQDATTKLQTVEQTVGNIDQYHAATQTEIRFRPGQTVLSANAKEALDSMATPLKSQRGYVVEVQGFASGNGQEAISNSRKMAESVVRYLVLNHDIPMYRIYVVGMGNAPVPAAAGDTAKPKRTNGGRVEISLLKNNLEQMSSNQK